MSETTQIEHLQSQITMLRLENAQLKHGQANLLLENSKLKLEHAELRKELLDFSKYMNEKIIYLMSSINPSNSRLEEICNKFNDLGYPKTQ